MTEAITRWSSEVSLAGGVAGSLDEDIRDLEHALSDLIDSIGDLDVNYVPSSVEDYEILSKAEALARIVNNGTDQARGEIQRARDTVTDLRRAVEFYRL